MSMFRASSSCGWFFHVSLQTAIYIIFFSDYLFSQKLHRVKNSFRNKGLNYESPDYRQGADQNTNQMLLHCQGNQFKSYSSELNNKQLKNKYANNNHNEQVIVSNISADVDLSFFKFSCIKKVENLQKDKNIKENT